MLKPTQAEIKEIKSWRDDPSKNHHQPHVERWEKVLAIWGENDLDVEPFTIEEIKTFAAKGWGRWITIENLYHQLESQQIQKENKKDPIPFVHSTLDHSNDDEDEFDDIVKEEDLNLDIKLDPRGSNDPWRFLTDQERNQLEKRLDDAYEYDDVEIIIKVNAILNDNEHPPKDYFSPHYVAQKAKENGDGLIERAIKWALEGKAWDTPWIEKAAEKYGLQDEKLRYLYNQKIIEVESIKQRQYKKEIEILENAPHIDWKGPISWNIETPVYPKSKEPWKQQWDAREDGQIFYSNGIHNDEKNKILHELPVLLYPEDFDRNGLIATVPLEAKEKFYKLIQFSGDNKTNKSIFRSHLIAGIRKNKGYSLIGILPVNQTWSVNGKITQWALDHNERRSYFLEKRRQEIAKVRDGEKEIAAFVEEKQIQNAIKRLISKGD